MGIQAGYVRTILTIVSTTAVRTMPLVWIILWVTPAGAQKATMEHTAKWR